MPQPPNRYTSRIQKGGALLDEMRQLVLLWSDAPVAENRAEIIRSNPLNKATRARIADVLNRVFIPRFVRGADPERMETPPTAGGTRAVAFDCSPCLFLADGSR